MFGIQNYIPLIFWDTAAWGPDWRAEYIAERFLSLVSEGGLEEELGDGGGENEPAVSKDTGGGEVGTIDDPDRRAISMKHWKHRKTKKIYSIKTKAHAFNFWQCLHAKYRYGHDHDHDRNDSNLIEILKQINKKNIFFNYKSSSQFERRWTSSGTRIIARLNAYVG